MTTPRLRDYARAMKFQTLEHVLRIVFERHWQPGKKFPTSALHKVAAKDNWPPLSGKDYALVLRALGFKQHRDGGRKDRRRFWRHPDPTATPASLARDLPDVLQLILGTLTAVGHTEGAWALRSLGDLRGEVKNLRSQGS